MPLQEVPDLQLVTYGRERFPHGVKTADFAILFYHHGHEVRGKGLELSYARYREIEAQDRLVWVVARSTETGRPIGYASVYWYRDLHFNECIAADDLWYVSPAFRGKGIGRTVRVMSHAALPDNVIRVYDLLRNAYNHPNLMSGLGYTLWGQRWVKPLTKTGPAGS